MKNLKLVISIIITFFCTNFIDAQDWANLHRFQKQNTALMALDSTEHRVVFMGNSITEGWLNIRPVFFADKPYVNRGISGQTTPQMLLRFRQDVIDLQPAAVVILAGINDIAGNTGPSTIKMIADNIKSMAELAKANGIAVVLCSVLPAASFPWRPELEPAQKVVQLNAILQAYAAESGFLYADYFSAVSDGANGLRADLGEDGVHPNAKGYAIMEPLLEGILLEALQE